MDGNSFYYLGQTINSIAKLKQRLFNPCIVIFNSKGEAFKEEVEFMVRGSALDAQVTIYHKKKEWESNNFDNSQLSPRKKHQSNDFYDMIKTVDSNFRVKDNTPIAIMEDDFIMCEGAYYHFGRIFEKIHELESSGKDWVGYRFSFGLNGVLIQRKDLGSMLRFLERESETDTPIDWLLEQYFHQLNHYGKLRFQDRLFYIYRYQLMKHIGVTSSVGNERNIERNNVDFPNCMEPQTQSQLLVLFQAEACPNSYFFPCNDTLTGSNTLTKRIPKSSMAGGIPYIDDKDYEFEHDTLRLPSYSSSNPLPLVELKKVRSVPCDASESCSTCCERLGSVCEPQFFSYINRCDELKRYAPNCKCMYERNPVLDSSSPLLDGDYCILGSRPSRFRCKNQMDGKRRLCPCFREKQNSFDRSRKTSNN
ncbi:hypothetical protein NAEGRDRAFT_57357 [Naegleria gruberi]|uniref:Glycosyltransferase family 18 catalytic domain-containing protein n=1 Tax=Naegleria gruberi TaxID=5762 RepID=D2V772_NAEGR|nr:uncharacterized protein NAEGRDRAFT_57357 [Naegleria gruberi]EFC47205.1 hypothetical protein NAEGRDRAFT_57357 [Naegleria gruberi]|eukprot:XP_002679949.1 hypothetical protein NAEGRDRAFT_57357 [Naegleria gruberi strain NEG-M]